MKAIIIGAGIGGLTTAIALEKIGIEVDVFERVPELKAVGAGLTLWANAIHALDKIGLGNTIPDMGMIQSGGIREKSGADIMVSDTTQLRHIADMTNIVVHRAELQDILIENFTGNIHYAKHLIGYQQSRDKVCAIFDDGTTVEGDLLIGCDGIHSAVRQQMCPSVTPQHAGYTAFRGVVNFDHAQVKNTWGETWGNGNRFGITPLSHNRVYWFATANSEPNKTIPTKDRKSALIKMFERWHDPIIGLIQATPDTEILQNDIYEIEPLESWQDGRVILSGDAAHAMTPNLGQGACQAIEDAIVLADCLKEYGLIDNALRSFQEKRIPRANAILKQSRMIGKLGQLENPTLCRIRNLAFQFMPAYLRNKNLASVIGYQV